MKPKIYTTQDHHIRNEHIDESALYVLNKLHEAGFKAYLVGGGVRDLLLHKQPKDFDISTSAKPEEIKNVFRRQCILIGRRFPLAHIRFGRDHVIEVATFRSGDVNEGELIVKDNVWGNEEEDVLRRDFTLNGLFYDPLDHKIIDYVGGFEDLQKHYLRCIGDPFVRFKQDPVRMLRMQKFRARFGFHVQEDAANALEQLKGEIVKSSSARVLEEIYRMLESGAAEPFFRLLFESQFLHILFPKLSFEIENTIKEDFFHYLKAADALNVRGYYKSLWRELLTAVLIYPILEKRVEEEAKQQNIQQGQIIEMTKNIIHELLVEPFSHFPKRLRQGAEFICTTQWRLTPLNPNRHPLKRVARHPDFIYPLTFLKLRSLIQPPLFKNYEYWKRVRKEFEESNEEQ